MKSKTIKNAKLFIIPNTAMHKENLYLLKDEKAETTLSSSKSGLFKDDLSGLRPLVLKSGPKQGQWAKITTNFEENSKQLSKETTE